MLLAALVIAVHAPVPSLHAPARPTGPRTLVSSPAEHGDLPWFEGDCGDLLKAAKAEGKPVMIDFWTTWCGWCKRLDHTTFSDADVVAALEGFLVWNVDAESKEGGKVARRFKVTSFPTLVFLDPDGSPRDLIQGFLPPEDFAVEARRLLRDEDTIGGYLARIEADPDDLDARLLLAKKYAIFQDRIGRQRQLREIEARDPKGETLAGEHCRLEREKTQILENWQNTRQIDTESLEAFLAESKHGEVRYAGWSHIAMTRYREARQLAGRASAERLSELRRLSRAAFEKAWASCPDDERLAEGVAMLNAYCETFDLTPQQKGFALQVARSLAADHPEDPTAYDALARSLQAAGEWDEAAAALQRCVELEPLNPQWKRRLAEVEALR